MYIKQILFVLEGLVRTLGGQLCGRLFRVFYLIRSSWFIAVVSCQQVKWVRIRTLSPAAQVNKHNPHAEHKKLFTPKCFLPSLSVLIYNSFTQQEVSCWQSMTSCLRHKLITLIFLRYYTDSVLFTYTLLYLWLFIYYLIFLISVYFYIIFLSSSFSFLYILIFLMILIIFIFYLSFSHFNNSS